MGISIRDVTVIVPTRGRKDRVGALLKTLDHPHDRTVLVVDEGRESIDLPDNLNGQKVMTCTPNCGCIKAMEVAIKDCKTSHLLLFNDDVEPQPGFIRKAVKFYNERFPDGRGLVALNHGDKYRHLGCFAIQPKAFYMEHLYPSPYKRYCLDNEWTAKARALGLYAQCEESVVVHDFPGHIEPDHTDDWKLHQQRMQEFEEKCPPKKLFIGVPVFAHVNVHFFDALIKFLQQPHSFKFQLACVAGDALVTRARNNLTVEFLKSDCTHLMMIDSDLVFSAEQIERLVAHNEDVVAGFYPKKKDGPECELVYNCFNPPKPTDHRRLISVRYMGTGFMLIRRNVIEKMVSEMGDELIYEVDGHPGKFGFDFWPVGVYKYQDGNRRYLSEDWYFCQRCLDLGFNVYGDTGVMLKHSGTAIYPLLCQQEKLFVKAPAEAGHDESPAAVVESPPAAVAALT